MPRATLSAPADAPAVRRDVRQQLLDAALALVQADGMHGFTQARVAAAAGVRQSHLTYYFPTRRDLLKALVEALHAGIVDALQTTAAAGQGAASLAALRDFFAARVRDMLLARLMLALMQATDEDPSLRAWLADFEQRTLAHLDDAFAQVGCRAPSDALGLFHATLVGASLLGAQHGTPAAAERAAHLTRLAFDRLVAALPAPCNTALSSPSISATP